MKTISCFIISFLLTGAVWAQSEAFEPAIKRNTVFVELGGPTSVLYSVNYDRVLTTSSPVRLSIQGGFSGSWGENGYLAVPITLNGFIGRGNHHLNVGVGGAYSYGKEGIIHFNDELITKFGAVDVVGRIGYRLQKPQGGFFLSVAYTPFMTIYTNNPLEGSVGNWINWLGIGLGRTF